MTSDKIHALESALIMSKLKYKTAIERFQMEINENESRKMN
jgi:hypothetical protein